MAGLIVIALLALLWRWESSGERAQRLAAEAEADRDEWDEEPAPRATFPTPPLDLPHYHGIGLDSGGQPALAGVAGDDGAASGTKEVSGG